MIVYEVMVEVDIEIAADFEHYMQEKHIPEILRRAVLARSASIVLRERAFALAMRPGRRKILIGTWLYTPHIFAPTFSRIFRRGRFLRARYGPG